MSEAKVAEDVIHMEGVCVFMKHVLRTVPHSLLRYDHCTRFIQITWHANNYYITTKK